jgi:hypothetical protein
MVGGVSLLHGKWGSCDARWLWGEGEAQLKDVVYALGLTAEWLTLGLCLFFNLSALFKLFLIRVMRISTAELGYHVQHKVRKVPCFRMVTAAARYVRIVPVL